MRLFLINFLLSFYFLYFSIFAHSFAEIPVGSRPPTVARKSQALALADAEKMRADEAEAELLELRLQLQQQKETYERLLEEVSREGSMTTGTESRVGVSRPSTAGRESGKSAIAEAEERKRESREAVEAEAEGLRTERQQLRDRLKKAEKEKRGADEKLKRERKVVDELKEQVIKLEMALTAAEEKNSPSGKRQSVRDRATSPMPSGLNGAAPSTFFAETGGTMPVGPFFDESADGLPQHWSRPPSREKSEFMLGRAHSSFFLSLFVFVCFCRRNNKKRKEKSEEKTERGERNVFFFYYFQSV